MPAVGKMPGRTIPANSPPRPAITNNPATGPNNHPATVRPSKRHRTRTLTMLPNVAGTANSITKDAQPSAASIAGSRPLIKNAHNKVKCAKNPVAPTAPTDAMAPADNTKGWREALPSGGSATDGGGGSGAYG